MGSQLLYNQQYIPSTLTEDELMEAAMKFYHPFPGAIHFSIWVTVEEIPSPSFTVQISSEVPSETVIFVKNGIPLSVIYPEITISDRIKDFLKPGKSKVR
jgi:hypothetical protein